MNDGRHGGDTSGPDATNAGADLAARLAEVQAKCDENWDLFLRTRADLENYRKRIDRDLPGMIRRGKRSLLERLLGVLDALDRAVEWEESEAGVRSAASDGLTAGEDSGPTALGGEPAPGSGGPAANGGGSAASMVVIRRLLLKALADEGVVPVECLGQPFDPAVHEAVVVQIDASATGALVTAELQRGYIHEGEVLRAARVQVTQPPG